MTRPAQRKSARKKETQKCADGRALKFQMAEFVPKISQHNFLGCFDIS